MSLEQRIADIIEPSLEDMGFDLVRVLLSGNQRLKLQIMAEPANGEMMTVDHCADISRTVSALLDVEDPIDKAYTLEISSPGIDRPLVRARDYERFEGFEARVELDTPLDGRRRFKCRLAGFEDGHVLMAADDGDAEMPTRLPLGAVKRAKLLLTDELIAAYQDQEDAVDPEMEKN